MAFLLERLERVHLASRYSRVNILAGALSLVSARLFSNDFTTGGGAGSSHEDGLWKPRFTRSLFRGPRALASFISLAAEYTPRSSRQAVVGLLCINDEKTRGVAVWQLFSAGRARGTILLWASYFVTFMVLVTSAAWTPTLSGRVLPDFRIGLPSGRHVSGTLGNPGPNTLQVPLQAVLAFSPAAAPDYGQHKGQAPDTPRRRSGTDGMLQHRCGTNKHGR
jgi:hypothetical protein